MSLVVPQAIGRQIVDGRQVELTFEVVGDRFERAGLGDDQRIDEFGQCPVFVAQILAAT